MAETLRGLSRATRTGFDAPMGYIDCDAHVWETDATWSYLAASEAQFKPATFRTWTANGLEKLMFAGPGWHMQHGESCIGDGTHLDDELKAYPSGTRTLRDVESRLLHMDELGVQTQICHSTGWTHNQIDNPEEELALARSYNRWIAEATEPSGGRLRWQIQPPMGTPEAVIDELRWGKAHGAVGINLSGFPHFRVLTDKVYFPIWEAAQELGLVCAVHAGQNPRRNPTPPDRRGIIWNVVSPVPGAFFHLLASDFGVRFPGLRWLFVEAGSMWAPWIVQQYSRAGEDLWRDMASDWRMDCLELLPERQLWISCEQDDDLPWVLRHLDNRQLVLGTGYGHFDMATDPHIHSVIDRSERLDAASKQRLVADNARELFGLADGPAA